MQYIRTSGPISFRWLDRFRPTSPRKTGYWTMPSASRLCSAGRKLRRGGRRREQKVTQPRTTTDRTAHMKGAHTAAAIHWLLSFVPGPTVLHRREGGRTCTDWAIIKSFNALALKHWSTVSRTLAFGCSLHVKAGTSLICPLSQWSDPISSSVIERLFHSSELRKQGIPQCRCALVA